MGALGHYLESEGLATAGLSLIRPHSEKIRPPRALCVPFELGRPLGVPNDAAFQKRVLRALIGLLGEPSGPVLRDYPEEAPAADPTDMDGMVCPVTLTSAGKGSESLPDRVRREVSELEAWYHLARERRGRTTYGSTGLDLPALLSFLTTWLDGTTPPSPMPWQPVEVALKQASEDLKVFYLEAMQAQPAPKSARLLYDWFWTEAAAGTMLVTIRDICMTSSNQAVRDTAANNLVPRAYFEHYGIKDVASQSNMAVSGHQQG